MSGPSRRELIRPSVDTPWDVQVVSKVPKKVEDVLAKSSSSDSAPVVGAVTEKWASVFVDHKVCVWSLEASLDQPKHVHTYYHARMVAASKVMLAMTSPNTNTASNSNDMVYAHAVTSDGHLWLFKVSSREKASSVPRGPHARVKVELDGDEQVTCLHAVGHAVIIGTSKHNIFWITVTSHPIMYSAQKVERETGFLGRMFSSATSVRQEPIVSIQALTPKVFLSVSSSGVVQEWKVTTTVASSHQATFEATSTTHLSALLRDQGKVRVQSLQVLRTTLHQRFLDLIVSISEQRIHFVRVSLSQQSTLHLEEMLWLSRFFPAVECLGLVATQNHTTYAVFQYPSSSDEQVGPVTCLAFSGNTVSEVDLPLIQSPQWIDGMLGRDFQTHGAWGLATSGLGIRLRFMGQQYPDKTSSEQSVVSSQTSTLARHLRSAFWQWYPQSGVSSSGGAIQLPPSIQQASPQELEPAILATAVHFQSQGAAGESALKYNPTEWHGSFLKMLLEAGLYRSVSTQGRWALLGIGQELAAYQVLHGRIVPTIQPHKVAQALADAQDASSPNFVPNLCLALETATQFRTDNASTRYDVMASQIPSHVIFTSQDVLQAVMRRQLQVWSEISGDLPPNQVTTVVTSALQSHMEACVDPNVYQDVKAVGIPLIRRIGNDSLAFDLSKTHSWNYGLCQLALDHENDDEFKLDDLLQDDVSFCQYVLQWNADRGLFHRVLNYGQNCPELLSQFLETDDRLRPYRWIAAIRAQEFEQAASFLLEAEASGSVPEIRRALSIAKMSCRKRRKLIDRKLELVKAQELLFGDSETLSLWAPDKLLSVALDRLNEGDDKIQTAVIALAIARASDDRLRMSAQVWTCCISADLDRWTEWLTTQHDLTDPQLRETILETTVFGGLWNEVKGQHEEDVVYGQALESLVLEWLGFDVLQNMEMRRLLHMVTTPSSV